MSTAQDYIFPPFRLDLKNAVLWREAQLVPLRPKTFAVLCYLIGRAERIVSHLELSEAVWGHTKVSPQVLRVSIRELRRVLQDNAQHPRFIETIARQGWRFIAPLRAEAAPVSSPTPTVPTPPPVITAPNTAESTTTFQPATWNPQSQTVLVGREAELAQLHHWLAKAWQGERQIVFVTGEPGIGKTTLIEAFLSQLKEQTEDQSRAPHEPPLQTANLWIARGQCIEHYGSGEPYMPILEAMERLCQTQEGQELVNHLRTQAPMWLLQMPSCLEHDERSVLQQQLLGASRERMLREFARLLEIATHDKTTATPPLLLLILEDLHWSDTATIELLAMLARRQEAARLLIVGTYRPVEIATSQHPLQHVVCELAAHRLCTSLQLSALSQNEIDDYLQQRFPFATLPLRLAEILHHRSGGNPLFLTNIVDDLIERELFVQYDGRWIMHVSLGDLAERIPDNLRYLIGRQIDRLPLTEQQLLGAASVAGAEFSSAAVAAALEVSVPSLEQQAEALVARHLFLRRVGIETWPDGTATARYGFHHALYQQLWHEHTTITRRQQWHQRIGQRKESAYLDQTSEIAAELAVHFEQARDYQRAARYHGQAADNAAHRHAYQEAIDHLAAALALLKLLPDTSVRDEQEISQQLTLGMLLTATKGYTAPEVEQAYARARDLSLRLGETPQLFSALHGLCRFFVVRASHDMARELGEQLVRLAQRQQNPVFLVEAHYALGTILFYLGQHEAARSHLESGIACYDSHQHLTHVSFFGQDPAVACRAQLSWILWILGYPEQAAQKSQEALTLAREFAHPFTTAFALYFAAVLHQFRREGQTAKRWAEELSAFAQKHAFSYWLMMAAVIIDKEAARHDTEAGGLTLVRQGLTTLQTTGTAIAQTYWLTLLVDANGSYEQHRESTAVIAQALEQAATQNERNWEPELYRLQGQLRLSQYPEVPSSQSTAQHPQHCPPPTQAEVEAEASFQKAIHLAHQQKARMLEIRAAVSLARLWKRQGRNMEARRMLSDLYHWFAEGFDTIDLQEARMLLNDL